MHIENFRLLKNVDITFDRNLTLFVGKNNTGKTSVMDVVTLMLFDRKYLSFDDYPLMARQSLYSAVLDYWQNKDLDKFQKSGTVIHECDEPLTAHFGHGSAKEKVNKSECQHLYYANKE